MKQTEEKNFLPTSLIFSPVLASSPGPPGPAGLPFPFPFGGILKYLSLLLLLLFFLLLLLLLQALLVYPCTSPLEASQKEIQNKVWTEVFFDNFTCPLKLHCFFSFHISFPRPYVMLRSFLHHSQFVDLHFWIEVWIELNSFWAQFNVDWIFQMYRTELNSLLFSILTGRQYYNSNLLKVPWVKLESGWFISCL